MEPQSPAVRPSRAGATLLGVAAIMLWSTTIACSRSMTEQLGTLTAAAAAYLAAGAIGCGTLAIRRRLLGTLRSADRRYLFGCGALLVAYTALLYVAVGFSRTRDQLVAVTVCNYLWPSLTLVFAVPLLGCRIRPWLLATGSLIAIIGVLLAIGFGDDIHEPWTWTTHAVTTGPAVAAAVAWGLYSNLSRRWSRGQDASAMPIFLLAAGVVLALLRTCRTEHPTWSAQAIGEVAYMAVFPTFAAYVCWDIAARRGNLPLLAALSYVTPVLSILASSLYLGLPIQPRQWLAGLMVVAGAGLSHASQHSTLHTPRHDSRSRTMPRAADQQFVADGGDLDGRDGPLALGESDQQG